MSITNSGFTGIRDEVVKKALDSTEGFTFVLAGLKAWLEHGIELNLVRPFSGWSKLTWASHSSRVRFRLTARDHQSTVRVNGNYVLACLMTSDLSQPWGDTFTQSPFIS